MRSSTRSSAAAHSIKGGAATFGFSDVAELTHIMETLLDKLRRHELQPTTQMIDILLQAGDALKGLLARHAGTSTEVMDSSGLVAGIRTLVDGGQLSGTPAPAPKAAAPAPAPQAAAPAPVLKSGVRELELVVGPLDQPDQANNLLELFKEITDLGTIEMLDGGQAADGMRRFKIVTGSSDNDLLDLFTFHVAREQVKLIPFGQGFGFHEGAPGAPPAEAPPATPATASSMTRRARRRRQRGRRPRTGPRSAQSRGGDHQAGRRRAQAGGRRRRRPIDLARVDREGRPADQSGRRTRHHPSHAGAEQPRR